MNKPDPMPFTTRQIRSFTPMVACVLFVCGTHLDIVSAQRVDSESRKVGLTKADSPQELFQGIKDLLAHVPTDGLDLIISNEDCTAALAAGWERVRRTVPVQESQEQMLTPNGQAIAHFIGLVKGRTLVPIPRRWEAAVQSANSYGRQNIWFPKPKDLTETTNGSKSSSADSRLHRDVDRWVLDLGKLTWSVPAAPPEWDEKPVVMFTAKQVYICYYHPTPTSYELYAVDLATAKVDWSAPVWADGGGITYTGARGWHLVELCIRSDAIIVFGVAGNVAYVEMFDRVDGRNMCRFGTRYFTP